MLLAMIVEKWNGILFCLYNIVSFLIYLFKYPQLRKMVKRNKELHNTHIGERCFLVLNGPSIRDKDLSFLENEQVFCTNFMFKSDLVKTILPNYYCWMDSKTPISAEWPNIVKEIKRRCPGVKMIVNGKARRSYEKFDKDVYYTYNKYKATNMGVPGKIDGISTGFFNVAFYAINIAIYMGFREIYVLGMDFEPGGFHLFDDLSVKDRFARDEYEKKIVCGDHWEYSQAQYESFYIAKHAKKHGARIINLNPNSHIRAFEFEEFDKFQLNLRGGR